MYNPIEAKRRFVEAQIQKSFDSGINVADEIELEKAHKDGDHHPTKPWVWVSSANGGKGDWRIEGGRSHKKAGASTPNTVGDKYRNLLKEQLMDDWNNKKFKSDEDKYNYFHNFLAFHENMTDNLWLEILDKKLLPNKDFYSIPKEERKKQAEYCREMAEKLLKGLKKQPATPAPRKPGSTGEIERMTAASVRSSILGLNNIATNIKDNGDHFKIDFDANDFNTNGKRSPQIDRIAKFLESMGASCVIGKNSIKAYKKVEAKKTTTSSTKKVDFSNMKLTDILDSLDNWSDDDWMDSKLNEKLSNAISAAIKKEKISEAEFSKITKNYQGLDLAYLDYVEKKPDFEDYAKNFIAEYRKKHPNDSVTKNSDLRGQTLKAYKEKYESEKQSDPRDGIAQRAGFKDYEEMRGFQHYVTIKNMVKSRLMQKKSKDAQRKEMETEIALYEKDHADIIKKKFGNKK